MVDWLARLICLSDGGLYKNQASFSEKDGREVPDTISVIMDFPNDLTAV
ncbi:MAG: hypothetical protein U0X75_16630 [Acidobacteriota bacterium]